MIVGIDRLVLELSDLGYTQISIQEADGKKYAIISGFEIPAGSHAGRVIDLGIPVSPDFPRSVEASMHVKATPHLFPFGHVPNVRNVIKSPLGNEWQYWSHRFRVSQINPSHELINQINEIFKRN